MRSGASVEMVSARPRFDDGDGAATTPGEPRDAQRILYERMFVDSTFSEEAFGDRLFDRQRAIDNR